MKKITLSMAGVSFRFSVVSLIAYLILLVVLCSLGNWQLRRAEQKKAFFLAQQTSADAETIDLNTVQHSELQSLEYRTVSVSGHYDEAHQFLIDSQVKNGQVGFFVMTPFLITGQGRAVLVNRGWVPMSPDRSLKTDIGIDRLETTVSGRVNYFPSVGLALDGADIPTDSWPAVVQLVNTDVLMKKLGYSLLDFQIELDSAMADGYLREWREISVMPPEKHIAYAVQWFALAFTLTLLFIWFSYKKNNE